MASGRYKKKSARAKAEADVNMFILDTPTGRRDEGKACSPITYVALLHATRRSNRKRKMVDTIRYQDENLMQSKTRRTTSDL